MEREPKFRGCGIFMPMQPINDLIKGDTCFDADAGYLIWDGKQWITDVFASIGNIVKPVYTEEEYYAPDNRHQADNPDNYKL